MLFRYRKFAADKCKEITATAPFLLYPEHNKSSRDISTKNAGKNLIQQNINYESF